jgi:hypothetical protein
MRDFDDPTTAGIDADRGAAILRKGKTGVNGTSPSTRAQERRRPTADVFNLIDNK